MHKMAKSNVFISGMKGLGVEIGLWRGFDFCQEKNAPLRCQNHVAQLKSLIN
jgi:hypothetical protein